MSGARGRWAALGVLCLALLAVVVDNTIVNVALPTLARELDADLAQLQWVVDAYTLTFAALLLPAGALGDRYGRRAALCWGLGAFAVASTGAAFADGVAPLVAARAAMGAGAAMIMPATLSLITGVFADPRERANAVGAWAATAGIGVALGPVLGGLLLDGFSWGAIFLVNVPICALALVGAMAFVPESRDPGERAVDWVAAGLSGAGLLALVWAIIEAPTRGWSTAPVLGAVLAAILLLVAFLIRSRRSAAPLLDFRLFRDPGFSAAGAAVTVLFFALFGFLFLSTQYLQFVLGFSPLEAGVRVLPYAFAMVALALASASVARRFGTRRVVGIGMLLFAAGLALAATVTVDTGYGRLASALVLLGAGMGLAGAPATESIMASLPPDRANVGSAVNDTSRELGGALGVAIVGSIASSIYASQLDRRLPRDLSAPVGDSLGAAVASAADVAEAAREAFIEAMSRASLVAALVTAFGAAVAWRFLPADR